MSQVLDNIDVNTWWWREVTRK